MKPKQFRLTKQKKIILDLLKKLRTHPTAEEIFKISQKKLPKISLATIYRNLESLEKKNLVLKLRAKTKDGKARYDGDLSKHCHLVCKNCGLVIDICECVKLIFKKTVLKKLKFTPCADSLEILGYCKYCQKK